MHSCTQGKQANIYNLQRMPSTISGLSLSRSMDSVQRPFAICSLVKNRDNSFWASFWAVVVCNSFAVTSLWVTFPGIHFLILETLMSPKKQPSPAWYTHTCTNTQKFSSSYLFSDETRVHPTLWTVYCRGQWLWSHSIRYTAVIAVI